ncbi:MAG: prepilin-type N-terminal cleavage/methylation domain-containing protein [bacterium]|nr:prepilin-type N-terminal cleavage/methylation domain-containing protein [bacterium]
MIDKLRSHLEGMRGAKKDKGFTLVELLVVIAIIAVLVLIVIVAINPIQRLADAADRRASANVRSTGTLIQTCITQRAPTTSSAVLYSATAGTGCADIAAGGTLSTYGTPANGVTIEANAGTTDICVSQQGATSGATPHWYNYRASTNGTPTGGVSTAAGSVQEQSGTMPGSVAGRCP